jgi:hypothetical protein
MGFLPTDWKSFVWGAAVVGALGAFFGAVLKKLGEDAYARLKSKWFGLKSSGGAVEIPSETMVLIPSPGHNALWWHMVSTGDQPAMQIGGELNVTNISKCGVYAMGAKLRKPKAFGYALMRAHGSNVYSFEHSIPPGRVSELQFYLLVQPPVCEKGKSFKGDVAIIDQFGNEHWLKGQEFRYS